MALAAAVSAATAAEEEETDDDDDDDIDVGDDVQVNYGSMLIAPLRDLLRSRRLSDSGKKAELIVRLEAHDNEEEPRAQDKTGDAENREGVAKPHGLLIYRVLFYGRFEFF